MVELPAARAYPSSRLSMAARAGFVWLMPPEAESPAALVDGASRRFAMPSMRVWTRAPEPAGAADLALVVLRFAGRFAVALLAVVFAFFAVAFLAVVFFAGFDFLPLAFFAAPLRFAALLFFAVLLLFPVLLLLLGLRAAIGSSLLPVCVRFVREAA